MPKPLLSALCLVKNEERWVWFAVQAMLPYVDELIIGDTGSTDRTVEILKTIHDPKITVTEHGAVSREKFATLRQEQIDRAQGAWILILDGDEIWPEDAAQELRSTLEKATPAKDRIAVRFYNAVGDIFHKQAEKYASYHILDQVGCITLRAFKKEGKQIRCDGPYGLEGYRDRTGDLGASADYDNTILLTHRYLHASFLVRANNVLGDWQIPYRRGKFLNVLGTEKVPQNFVLPKVFQSSYPAEVRNPLEKRSFLYFLCFGILSQAAYRLYRLKQKVKS